MRIDDIKIFSCFEERPPRVEKLEQKEQYFIETGSRRNLVKLSLVSK